MNYERILGNKRLPFRILLHKVNEKEPHWHDNIEFLFILKGSVEIRLRNRKYILKKEDLFIINKNEIHEVSRTEDDNLLLLLQLDLKYYSNYYPNLKIIKYKNNFFNDEKNKQNANDLKKHMANLVWILNKKEVGYKFNMGSEINLFLSSFMKNFNNVKLEENINSNEDDKFDKIKKILDYMDKNFVQGISLAEIAEKFYFSNSYLSRFFKEMMGMTFQEYLDYLRLNRASELLLSTEKRVIEVANESGIQNVKTLNRIFREYYDTTPSAFREEYKDVNIKLEQTIEKNDIESNSYYEVHRTKKYKYLFKYLDLGDDSKNIDKFHSKTNDICINIDAKKKSRKLKKYWQILTTMGRAAEGLREDVQIQLRNLQKHIGFKYIRFHGIFADDMMIYNTGKDGIVEYNWSYVDKLFDFLKEVDIKPFVGLSFMPSELKSSDETMFWWNANISQPKDIKLWKDLVSEFIKHCINRYGLEEVESWYFEVWNEPSIEQVFWIGGKEQYFSFFKETFLSIKSISKGLKVGGPAIAYQGINSDSWLEDFFIYCNNENIFLNFISLHAYPDDFKSDEDIVEIMDENLKNLDRSEMANKAMELQRIYSEEEYIYNTLEYANKEINKYLDYKPELHITEWNASALDGNKIHDTSYIATYIVKNILDNIGMANSLAYWTFTDIMEEFKVKNAPFRGGFGLINRDGIRKPSYYSYYLLSLLGQELIEGGEDYVVTKTGENIQILVYNFAYFNEMFLSGDTSALLEDNRYMVFEEKDVNEVTINIKNIQGRYKVTKYKLDRNNGSAYDNWIRSGFPENMNKEEIDYLKDISQPSIRVEYINIDEKYKDKIYTEVHGIDFIILEKII